MQSCFSISKELPKSADYLLIIFGEDIFG